MQRDPEDVKEFITESLAYLDSSEPILAELQAQPTQPLADMAAPIATIFRAFHSIKGVAGFLSYTNVQEVTHKAEGTLDRVRTGKRNFDRELGATLLEACDLLRKYFSAIQTLGEDAGFVEERDQLVIRLKLYCETDAPVSLESQVTLSGPGQKGELYDWLLDENLLKKFSEGGQELVNQVESILIQLLDKPESLNLFLEAGALLSKFEFNANAFGFKVAADLGRAAHLSLSRPRSVENGFNSMDISSYFDACNILKALLKNREPEPPQVEQSQLAIQVLEKLPEIKVSSVNTISVNDVPATQVATTPSSAQGASAKHEIRVSLERLDKMVDLIEELGVVSTGVYSVAEYLEDGHGLIQTASKLRKITEELQEITVSIRMVPLSTVFRKMIRLVGDVSSKLGKKIKLEIIGEQTELDKDAVESLQDPLVHILRNCVDHGIEMPEERALTDKPEIGVIKLQAWHSGGEAWICISDDGKGISSEKVFSKAVSQGLVAANAVLTDTEILAFIFHPGFSLAKEVTEFSGRGVGMDVVKKNIQSLKGRVDIESKLGKGTTFTIRLPMANALTESMLVRVGNVKYVLRVASIQETFQPAKSAISRLPNGDEMVSLRGKLYPVIRINKIHKIANSEQNLEHGLIIIVENRGKQTGLFVDEVLGKIQAVIKPPPPLLKSATTIAGCSIIGTDSDAVALALDINALDEKMLEVTP